MVQKRLILATTRLLSRIILVICALATVAFSQTRILCELQDSFHSQAPTHSHSAAGHADSHEHGHNNAHSHEHESTENTESSNTTEESCCEEEGGAVSLHAASGLRIDKHLSALVASKPAVLETKTLLVLIENQNIPKPEHRSIPPPLSTHIPTTILRI